MQMSGNKFLYENLICCLPNNVVLSFSFLKNKANNPIQTFWFVIALKTKVSHYIKKKNPVLEIVLNLTCRNFKHIIQRGQTLFIANFSLYLWLYMKSIWVDIYILNIFSYYYLLTCYPWNFVSSKQISGPMLTCPLILFVKNLFSKCILSKFLYS